MKEIKVFFANNNRLNKGYTKIHNPNQTRNNAYRQNFQHVLPPIDVMSQYEEMNPGTLAQLMSMAQTEQNRRHESELLVINERCSLIKRGQNLAVFMLIIICLITVLMTVLSSVIYAIIFFAISFLPISILSILSYNKINKKHKENPVPYSKPSYSNNHNNRRHSS